MSAPTFRARPMWTETNPIDSSTSRIRRILASSTRWAASTKLSRAAGRFLRSSQRGLELAFLEPFAGLIEQFLDPFVVDIGVASQHESRIPFRGVLGLEFHEDLGGAGGGGDGGDQVRFPLQSEEAHPMSLAELAELTGSKSF